MHSLVQFDVSQFNAGLVYACPEIFLGLLACAILMLDLLLNDAQRRWTGWLACASLIVTAVLVAVHGFKNSSLIETSDGLSAFSIVMRPSPTLSLPTNT